MWFNVFYVCFYTFFIKVKKTCSFNVFYLPINVVNVHDLNNNLKVTTRPLAPREAPRSAQPSLGQLSLPSLWDR